MTERPAWRAATGWSLLSVLCGCGAYLAVVVDRATALREREMRGAHGLVSQSAHVFGSMAVDTFFGVLIVLQTAGIGLVAGVLLTFALIAMPRRLVTRVWFGATLVAAAVAIGAIFGATIDWPKL